jgi:endonuclease/exonuclease/phosphatase family metal-dependent hydrolase
MVKVATWNLWWRYGDWQARQPVITVELRALNADIVGLQEVWHTREHNGAAQLAEALGYQLAFATSPAPDKWQQKLGDASAGIGNAMLSRWPIVQTATVRLPPGEAADEGRIGLHARIETPHGTLPFFTTHLNSGWAQSTIRTQQLATIGRFILEQPPGAFPPLLCGDFNADVDFDEIRAFSGKREALVEGLALLDVWPFLHPLEPGWTWDRRNPHVDATNEPSARIDYVFVGFPADGRTGKPIAAGLFGTEPLNGVWPSDHFGVWVELAAAPN